MPEQKFDFSKPEDQERFSKLPEEEQQKIVLGGKREAEESELNKKVFGYKSYSLAAEHLKIFPLPEAEIQVAVKQALLKHCSDGNGYDASGLLRNFPLPQIELKSPEVQAAVKQGVIHRLADGNLSTVIELLKYIPLSENDLSSPEVQTAVKQGFVYQLLKSNYSAAKEFLVRFTLPTGEVHAAIKRQLIDWLTLGYDSNVRQLLSYFSLPEVERISPEVRAAIKQGLILTLPRFSSHAINLLKEFPLSEVERTSPEIQAATRQRIFSELAEGNYSTAKEFLTHIPLLETEMSSSEVGAVKKGLINHLTKDDYSSATELLKHFPLPEAELASPEVQAAIKQGFINQLTSDNVGNYDRAASLLECIPLLEVEVQAGVKQVLTKYLAEGHYAGAEEVQNRFPLTKEVLRDEVFPNLEFATFRLSAEACGLTAEDIVDSNHRLLMELPPIGELNTLNALVGHDYIDEIREVQGVTGRTNRLFELCYKEVWQDSGPEVAGWYDSFVAALGGDKTAANRYLEAACREGRSTHDALQFLPKLAEEYASDPSAFQELITAIRNPDDAARFAEYAPSYAAARLQEFSPSGAPRTLRDFIRVCILIKKNFRFPEGVSGTVREKITLILDTVGDTEQLAEDLQDSDGRLIRLLENRDGLDEQALIQPIPELSLRITSLGKVLQGALGSRELQKLQGVTGQLHRDIGPLILDLQKRALASEEFKLRESNPEIYGRPKDDVELINLKKANERHLDSLKVVKGKGFDVTEDKGGTGARLARLIEALPAYRDGGPEQKVQVRHETLMPLYERLAALLTRDRVGGTVPTDPVLAHLAAAVEGKTDGGETLAQGPDESAVEFRERAATYAEAALDEYLALARKTQQLAGSSELYRQVERLVLQENEEGDREATKSFFADPDAYLATRPLLAGELENLLQAKGIDTGDTLVARVHAKSDARGIVCGDATNCCMPYGDDKNYDYMYRRDTAYFTVALSRDGAERTVAQSVLVAGEPSGKKKAVPDGGEGWNTLAFDNVEVAHTYEKLVPDIAKLYRKVIAECWPEKMLIMGTSYNDDRELVREMGELVRNEYQPVEGELTYSDCFSHDTVIKLRGPVGEQTGGIRPRLGFVTPAMLERDSPFLGQLAANFKLSDADLERLRGTLAPTQRVLRRDEDNDPVFEADNRSVQVSMGGKPMLLVTAIDGERPEGDQWDEVTVAEVRPAAGVSKKQVENALVSFLSVQPSEGYRIALPAAFLSDYNIDPESLAKRAGFASTEARDAAILFIGTPESDEEEEDNEEDDA
ncbi:MAG: hypothetical protein Q7S84_00615 [bacterium]|nr:hypothetical protein [bacterium]